MINISLAKQCCSRNPTMENQEGTRSNFAPFNQWSSFSFRCQFRKNQKKSFLSVVPANSTRGEQLLLQLLLLPLLLLLLLPLFPVFSRRKKIRQTNQGSRKGYFRVGNFSFLFFLFLGLLLDPNNDGPYKKRIEPPSAINSLIIQPILSVVCYSTVLQY